MATDNPFRQPLRRKNVRLKTTVRQADGNGKDAGGNTDFAIGDDYLWIAFYFSVPLRWVTDVEPVGPGFYIAWHDPVSRRDESAAFCVLRTGWGYNTRRRDELVERVREAVVQAGNKPPAVEVSTAETISKCQKCGELNPRVFDFTWFTNFLTHFISKPDRRVLCLPHGAQRIRLVTLYNLFFGNLGLGVFASPMINFRNIRAARVVDAIGPIEASVWIALAFLPYAALAWAVSWSVWFAINF